LLSNDPGTNGEDFYGDRLLVVGPLHVTFTLSPDDWRVTVLDVWHVGP
jgi:hypothetical protein